MSDWCILRTSGRNTLRLAASLADDGLEVWTPTETKRLRIPRKTAHREVTLPIMPSYVFAKADHLVELLHPQTAGPSFSVMRHGDSFPLVRDQHLQALRQIEARRAQPKRATRIFAPGVEITVKIEGGSFAGMQGRVERCDPLHTLVCFDERLTVRIATCLLEERSLKLARSFNEAARKAA